MDYHHHYQRAVALAGSETLLAKALGVQQQTLNRIAKRGPLPAELAVEVERVTRGAVTRLQLRPDLFGPIDPPLVDAPFLIPAAGVSAAPPQEN